MPKKVEKNLIVGLDIGTSKVTAIVAEVGEGDSLDIIGVGVHSCHGLKKGVVVDIDATVQAVNMAVEEAEYMAGCKIHSVYTGIAGSHIQGFNSHGIVAIRDHIINAGDVDRVIDAAKAILIPPDQKILHILPQEFIVDKQAGIQEPIGMVGVRLETNVHMVTGSVNAAQNIVTCVRNAGLEVEDIILEQLASSEAVLSDDEKQQGVCVIDIGGGTTDIAVFLEGAIYHTAVIAVAGDQVTNDIAVALRTSIQSAESLKIQYATALIRLANPEQIINVPLVGDTHKKVAGTTLAAVVEPRFEELFSLVRSELNQHQLSDLLEAGIVITGGSAKMPGVIELASEIFQTSVRLGIPMGISGLTEVVRNPIYSTGVGLLKYGYRTREQHQSDSNAAPSFKGMVGRVKQWFQGHF
jgi:cell division protein FtsA